MAALIQKAVVIPEAKADWKLVNDWPVPTHGPKDVLVKLISTGLNPADWKIQARGFPIGTTNYPVLMGIEGAGIVEEIGADVTTFVKGDKVLFTGGGYNQLANTFQQYAICPADNASKIPDNITFDQAASVPIALATVACGLWAHHPEARSLDFPAPWEEGGLTKFVGQAAFIHGGSSSVGQYAIQMAKLQGFSPIFTTASPRHEEFLKNLGATHFVDRNLPADTIIEKIRELAAGKPIIYAYAAVSEPDDQNLAYDVVAPNGFLAVSHPFSEAFLAEKEARDKRSKKVVRPMASYALPGNKKLGEEFCPRITEWLANGVLVPNRVEVLPGGLAAVKEGVDRLQNGLVSGVKLIVHPQETP